MTNSAPTVRVPEDDAESTTSLQDDPNYLSFRYHTDLLDASWGSYLHSAGDKTPRKVSINDSAAVVPEAARSQQPSRSLSDNKVPKGILRTTEAKEDPLASKQLVEPRPLTKDLNALEAALKTARDDSRALGIEAAAGILSNSCDLLAKVQAERESALREDKMSCSVHRNSLQVVAACLKNLLEGLMESYQHMKTQEENLESLEEELCRKQVQFLKEQEDVEQHIKSPQGQPHPPASVHVKSPKVPVRLPKVRAIPSLPTKTLPYTTTHGIGQLKPLVKPRSQMETLVKTHAEQRRLERALFSQQKEIDNLDRSHAQTKKDLISAQQHIAQLHKQLKHVSTEATKVTALYTNPSKDTKEIKLSGMATDERAEQQMPKLDLTKKVLKMPSKLAQQRMEATGKQELHYPSLPMLHKSSPSQSKMQQKPIQSLVLPSISQHNSEPPGGALNYSFTSDELFSLASFNDPITAAQVIQWLKKQGRLKDQPHA